MNIKARLNLGNKTFSQKLNQKFSNMLKLMTEADCLTEKITPQQLVHIRKLGGIRNYAAHLVETMPRSASLQSIENLISSYYGDDEEYRRSMGWRPMDLMR